MSNKITIVDYGTGNIGSVLNMIKRAGGMAIASSDVVVLAQASKLLLPGVGSFDNALRKLESLGLTSTLKEQAQVGTPILGICLGMQLLSEGSEEGLLPGLGLIPGTVSRFSFSPADSTLKIPHMGWNKVKVSKPHALVAGINDDSRFYFVHSYHYQCADPADILLETIHSYNFVSGVQRGNVMGVQFHPEKSHRYGMQLFKNFVNL